MESHILNSYHRARYGSGHQLLRSSSSDGGSQTCPEYLPEGKYQSGRKYWKGHDWSQNETINMTRSQDTSSDEDETVDVQELVCDDQDQHPDSPAHEVVEETLVEGDDYDVIQVFAVDPDLDLEVSDDEENETYDDYCVENSQADVQVDSHDKGLEVNFNLDAPVVSNVDDYFKDYKHILDAKDEPVVKDVDEYFIKETKPKNPEQNEPFIKDKQEGGQDTGDRVSIALDYEEINKDSNLDETIKDTDLEILPNIEDLRRFLLEDMTYTKFKSAQKSCSLPQSPMHNIYLDIDDSKTCLSFEDLDLDLSDLTFDNHKEKSGNSSKSDDLPVTLTDEDVNSFLITNTNVDEARMSEVTGIEQDDLSQQDMEIERPVETILPHNIAPITVKTEALVPHIDRPVVTPIKIKTPKKTTDEVTPPKTTTPVATPKTNVLDFCIEKPVPKKQVANMKTEPEDFVDVVSCNDTTIPVLEANNLSSLLEQFEATEKLNMKPKKAVKVDEKVKGASLTNGMRLQDAGVQLNKTKMRQILMPSTVAINAPVRPPSPLLPDHDYCSTKKRCSLPNIKGGQSLLKPEVLSSNSRILNSRHRTCKNKKVVYHISSDDDQKVVKEKKNVTRDDCYIKSKPSVKDSVNKVIHQPTTRKKLYAANFANDFKSNSTVIHKEACKASDTKGSQNPNTSIKLTIKNKSEVIINCDERHSQKTKVKDKCNVSEKVYKKTLNADKNKVVTDKTNEHSIDKHDIVKVIDSNDYKVLDSIAKTNSYINVTVKVEPCEKTEDFYTGLFDNKQDVRIPQAMQPKAEKRTFKDEIRIEAQLNKDTEQPVKRKKLNLQEYKLRRGVNSNTNSAAVSPELIFPEMPTLQIPKVLKPPPPIHNHVADKTQDPEVKKIFDPIREASRKILMNTKKHKAEVMRRKEEDMVMRKIPKVENLELQPLISDAEMMKIVGLVNNNNLQISKIDTDKPIAEKPQASPEYEEITLVSVGVNTDEAIFKELKEFITKSPTSSNLKSLINFRIKKSEQVIQKNVFDSANNDKKCSPKKTESTDLKMDKERFKDITATLKSVSRQVDPRISSNSLFASIKAVVKKKAPEEVTIKTEKSSRRPKSVSPKRFSACKTTIVRDYDTTVQHGEDKVILHLGKDRSKPKSSSIDTQTEPDLPKKDEVKPSRKRNDSDMSISSVISVNTRTETPPNTQKNDREIRCKSEKRSRSKDRQEFRRKSPHRRRSRSRTQDLGRRSRSHDRRRYRSRRDSPYRRKSPRRSPSTRREYRSRRSRSERSTSRKTRSKTPMARRTPQLREAEKKIDRSVTPPRQRTVSESSSSSRSSSSSSSSSSEESKQSRRSCSYRREEYRSKYKSFSSEDMEAVTLVEERRIVFVGRLEPDITKAGLRSQFNRFGPVVEVRLHSKEDGTRYGFVTFERARDAWSAVEAAGTLPHYDVGFGGRRAFCRHSYADLDGLEAKYTESAFHGSGFALRRTQDMSFEQMLLEMKRKLSQRKGEENRQEEGN